MIVLKRKPDLVGTLASTLCLVHCVATPFIFIAQSSVFGSGGEPPVWWKFLDYMFLAISFIAVYWSTSTTNLNWIKPLFWISWILLLGIILNEKLAILSFPEVLIYIPTISLVILHLYNKKYCNCNNDKCCVNEG